MNRSSQATPTAGAVFGANALRTSGLRDATASRWSSSERLRRQRSRPRVAAVAMTGCVHADRAVCAMASTCACSARSRSSRPGRRRCRSCSHDQVAELDRHPGGRSGRLSAISRIVRSRSGLGRESTWRCGPLGDEADVRVKPAGFDLGIQDDLAGPAKGGFPEQPGPGYEKTADPARGRFLVVSAPPPQGGDVLDFEAGVEQGGFQRPGKASRRSGRPPRRRRAAAS